MGKKFAIPDEEFEVNIKQKPVNKDKVTPEVVTPETPEVEAVKSAAQRNVRTSAYMRNINLPERNIGETQGKKGEKLPQMTMRFSTRNYEYVRRMSRKAGLSGTAFVNVLIDMAREGEIDLTMRMTIL